MLSYHSDPAIKARYVARIEAHADADEIIKGKYWQDGKGCAVGCTIHGDSHEAFERELGIPRMLAWLEDTIFEGLPNRAAKAWPARFLSDIAPGRDLAPVGWQLLHWLLTDSKLADFSDPLIEHSVNHCAAVLSQLSRGHGVDAAWAKIVSGVAWEAHTKAKAALQESDATHWAAESVARAASSAALCHTDATASAEMAVTALTAAVTRSRDYVIVGDKLLELLRAAGAVDVPRYGDGQSEFGTHRPGAQQPDACDDFRFLRPAENMEHLG